MSISDEPAQNTPIRPVQFTLRGLLIATTAGCVFLAAALYWEPLVWAIVYFGACGAVMLWGIIIRSHAWLERGIWAALGGMAMSCLISGVSGSRDGSPRMACSNNLHQIALAMEMYHDDYDSFPPAYVSDANGLPMHSWRVLLLPYLEQRNLYKAYRFDEPWDGPNNRKLHGPILRVYCCPFCCEKGATTETNYLLVVGPQTMWPYDKGIPARSITNGRSKTIMVVEVADSGIHWMEPRDLSVIQMPMQINAPRGQGISSRHANGANVVFADGHVRFLPNDLPAETLRALLTRAGGEKVTLP